MPDTPKIDDMPTAILRQLFNDAEFCQRTIPLLKPEYFTAEHRVIFERLVGYFQRYHHKPSVLEIGIEIQSRRGKLEADEILESCKSGAVPW